MCNLAKLAVLRACHGRQCTRGENHSVLGDREKIRNTCETNCNDCAAIAHRLAQLKGWFMSSRAAGDMAPHCFKVPRDDRVRHTPGHVRNLYLRAVRHNSSCRKAYPEFVVWYSRET